MGRLLRAPLLHFLVLGLLGFWVYDVLGGPSNDGSQIVVREADVDRLRSGFQSQWSRPPDAQEMQGLIDAWVREETLYREALALGLDRDDTIVRRRLAQKMEFLAADTGGPVAPDDGALAAFLARHPERFEVPARYTLRQVYVSPDRRGDHAPADARAALAKLRAGAEPATLGDPLLLGERHAGVTADRLAQLFGPDFAGSVAALEPGAWAGPIQSGYGLHLVRVESREEARQPGLQEVRERVLDEWFAEQREERLAAFHAALRERYPVRIEAELPEAP